MNQHQRRRLEKFVLALEHEIEFRRCQRDFFYFVEHYWWVKNPGESSGSTLFTPWPAQRQIIQDLFTEQKVIALKARQIGYSTIAAAVCFWEAWVGPDRFFPMLSRRESDSKKLLAKVIYGYDKLPEWMKQRGPHRTDRGSLSFTLSNGSELMAAPSKNDPARGDTAFRVILDEWAFFENQDEAWASVEPAIDVGGRIFALSTANGSGNGFHRFWDRAVHEINGFKAVFVPWSANPERDQTWYARKVQELEEWQLHQEYPDSPEMAFRKSGRTVFDTDKLIELKAFCQFPSPDSPWPMFGVFKGHDEFSPSIDGNWVVYAPREPTGRYAVGADTSGNTIDGDASAAHIIRLAHWEGDTFVDTEVVAVYRGYLDPDEFAHELDVAGRYYNTAKICVEANTHGLTTLRELKHKIGYQNLYYRRLDKVERRDKRTKSLGFYTNAYSKPPLIDELNKAIRDDLCYCPDERTLSEAIGYVREDNGTMHGSPNDDLVMSWALALECTRQVSADDPPAIESEQHGFTFDTAIALLEQQERIDSGREGTIGRRPFENARPTWRHVR